MTQEEFKMAKDIIWDGELGPQITCDTEISNLLAEDLKSAGIKVARVGRKPRSRQKFIVFDIEVVRIVGLDMMFLSEEEAQDWHKAKNRSLKTLMKAPDEAFQPVKVEIHTEMLWWSQAFNLAYRLEAVNLCKERILKKRGVVIGRRYGL